MALAPASEAVCAVGCPDVTDSKAIRATYDDDTIVVYQAYSPQIATPSLAAQHLCGSFSMTRMTWIKPSFLWCCYRSGWARKPNQERILAIRITREGFHAALAAASLATYNERLHGTREAFAAALASRPNRVQWDPERDVALRPIPRVRSLQLGIGAAQVPRYVHEWTVDIADLTDLAREIESLVAAREESAAKALLPYASAYPLPDEIGREIDAGEPAAPRG